MTVYRDVPGYEGLQCTPEGKFRYNGKVKKVIYAKKNFGNEKATARITIHKPGAKTTYLQAAKGSGDDVVERI